MKVTKRAAVSPFFTPLIVVLIGLIVAICGLIYSWWMQKNVPEFPKEPEREEAYVDTDYNLANLQPYVFENNI